MVVKPVWRAFRDIDRTGFSRFERRRLHLEVQDLALLFPAEALPLALPRLVVQPWSGGELLSLPQLQLPLLCPLPLEQVLQLAPVATLGLFPESLLLPHFQIQRPAFVLPAQIRRVRSRYNRTERDQKGGCSGVCFEGFHTLYPITTSAGHPDVTAIHPDRFSKSANSTLFIVTVLQLQFLDQYHQGEDYCI